MKTEKKHVGTKAEVRVLKERERRIATAIFLIIILLVLIFSAYFTYTILTRPSGYSPAEPSLQFKPDNPDPQLKAAIADQLSLTFPNQSFIEEAATILVNANYTVDYFGGEEVTVEFYRNLPAYDYKLIILRVHSAIRIDGGPPVTLFTSEPYSQKSHVSEQLADQLAPVHYIIGDKEELYFAITPSFVKYCQNGKFQNSLIVLMGCNGLTHTDMAEALIERGAKAYISWKTSVSATLTDTCTTQLLEHLITQKQTIEQAVENTMKEVGSDLAPESVLNYYPLKVGKQTIENFGKS
jgi:hypothetical protein